MKRYILIWQGSGFVAVSILGTLLHFLYDWLGNSIWIAPFSGVNESTFEHMKLFFWSAFLFAFVQSFFFKKINDAFWLIKLRSILLGLILIPIIFYTFNGAIGKTPDWFNISIFFISTLLAFIYETRLILSKKTTMQASLLPFFILCAVAVLFTVFTFYAPEIELFRDPLTGIYGI